MLRWSTSDDLLRVGYGSEKRIRPQHRLWTDFLCGDSTEAGLFVPFRIGAICPFRTGLFDLFQTGLFSPFQPPPSVSALRSPVCEVAGFTPPFGLRRLRNSILLQFAKLQVLPLPLGLRRLQNSILLQFAELEESRPLPWFEGAAEFTAPPLGLWPPPSGYLKKIEEISL